MSTNDSALGNDGRRDRLIQQSVNDPYMRRAKLSGPTVCPECGVVFSAGRWQWQASAPEEAQSHLCPACLRIRDRVPAGYLFLSGNFFKEHKNEIINLLHNKVNQQKAHHPLQRVMEVDYQDGGGAEITFTDVHLPQGVGEALQRAYEGDLDIKYTEDIVRVYWQRGD